MADPPEEPRRRDYSAADSDDSEDRDRTTQPSQEYEGIVLGVAKIISYYSPNQWPDRHGTDAEADGQGRQADADGRDRTQHNTEEKTDEQPTQNDQDDFVEAKGEKRTGDEIGDTARKGARLAGYPPHPDMGPQAARHITKWEYVD